MPFALLPRSRRRRQGMAVLATLLILFCLLSIALVGLIALGGGVSSGMMSNADNSSKFAQDLQSNIGAVNLADAGVQYAILWLSAQSVPPPNTTAFAPSSASFTTPLWNAATVAGSPPRSVVDFPDANHTFSVTLYPCSGNASSAQKGYVIESIGSVYGVYQVAHVYVVQASFAHYAFFENGAGGGVWSSSGLTFDGPVHMNYNPGTTHPMTLNWVDGTPPIFDYDGPDAYTVGFTLGWEHNGVSVSGPPASNDTTGWNELSPFGPTSIKQNQNNIGLPTSPADLAEQETAALGSLSVAPTSAIGATVCPGGGIYIHGDVQQMTLSVGANSSTQVIELYQIDPSNGNLPYTKITLDTATNQTEVETGAWTVAGTVTLNPSSSWPAPTAGLTNGVVYCDGNIGGTTQFYEGGLRGVIADNKMSGSNAVHSNALTIATSPSNNIQLDGSLVTNTQRQIQQNAGGQYEFMNQNAVMVTSTSTTTPSGCFPLYVPESADTGAFVKQAGTLGIVTDNLVEGAYTFNASGMVCGGYQQNLEIDASCFSYGTFGTSPYSPGHASLAVEVMGGDIHNGPEPGNGYNTYYCACYDNRLSDYPPPDFPTTNNRYTVVSWQRADSVIEGTL